MADTEKRFRTFHLGGGTLKVPIRLDELTGRYFLDCPDLEERRVYTKSGFLWVNAVQDTCLYHRSDPPEEGAYHDCGSCCFFQREQPQDIIGICLCEALHKHEEATR